MPHTYQKITPADRERRRDDARRAGLANQRAAARRRAQDPAKLNHAALTVRAALAMGHLALDDLTAEVDR